MFGGFIFCVRFIVLWSLLAHQSRSDDDDDDTLTSTDATVSIQMVLQLDADLSVGRLFTQEGVLQQLVCVGTLHVVFDETDADKIHELLGPVNHHQQHHLST